METSAPSTFDCFIRLCYLYAGRYVFEFVFSVTPNQLGKDFLICLLCNYNSSLTQHFGIVNNLFFFSRYLGSSKPLKKNLYLVNRESLKKQPRS